jgi:RES domain
MAGSGSQPNWDPNAAVAQCPLVPWVGEVWRSHARRYAGDNPGGSLATTGRYHKGLDYFPEHEVWPALYTSLAVHIALGERIRHTPEVHLQRLRQLRISHLAVELQAVLNACESIDCLSPVIPGLTIENICKVSPAKGRDALVSSYEQTHAFAQAARVLKIEGLLIPSCTKFRGGKLIVFSDLLRPGSRITVLSTEDPELYT